MNEYKDNDNPNHKPSASEIEAIKKDIDASQEKSSSDGLRNNGDNTNKTEEFAPYLYQDFSNIPNDASYLDTIRSRVQPPSKKLPTKLNDMLSDPDLLSIIAWLPHGRSWQILDRYRFTNEVLPKHFDHSNFESFIRLVNAWGFRRVPSGVDRDSYYHELFLRGLPHLHKRMKRTNSKKAPMESRHQHPNFYKMPLPDDPYTSTVTRSNKATVIDRSSANPPPPNITGSKNDTGAQVYGGIHRIQGACGTSSSLNHQNHSYSSLAGNAMQPSATNPQMPMQGLQQSMSQPISQQSVGMFPPNIFWNPSSNTQFLAPSTVSASIAGSASASNHAPIMSFPTSLDPTSWFCPQLFQPQHPRQHQQRLPVHLGTHALSQQPIQSQTASLNTASSQSQDPIEQCSNQIPPSHPTQTHLWTNLPSSLPTIQYQNLMATPFLRGNANNMQDSSSTTTSFNSLVGRGRQQGRQNNGDTNEF